MRKVTFKVASRRDGSVLTKRLMDQGFSVNRLPTLPAGEMIYGYGDPERQSEDSAFELAAGLNVQIVMDETA